MSSEDASVDVDERPIVFIIAALNWPKRFQVTDAGIFVFHDEGEERTR
jgi:hypothetical protein